MRGDPVFRQLSAQLVETAQRDLEMTPRGRVLLAPEPQHARHPGGIGQASVFHCSSLREAVTPSASSPCLRLIVLSVIVCIVNCQFPHVRIRQPPALANALEISCYHHRISGIMSADCHGIIVLVEDRVYRLHFVVNFSLERY